MEAEQRRRTRVAVHGEVTVQVGQEPIRMEMENISLNGMLCAPEPRLAEGDEATVLIVLAPDAVIAAQARVVRSDARGAAIAFTGIDEEGFPHLLKLVQYNSADADRIDQELGRAGFSAKTR